MQENLAETRKPCEQSIRKGLTEIKATPTEIHTFAAVIEDPECVQRSRDIVAYLGPVPRLPRQRLDQAPECGLDEGSVGVALKGLAQAQAMPAAYAPAS